jgi:hypothetical protein
MTFFEGGLTYADLMEMPLPEISTWIEVANKISKERSSNSSGGNSVVEHNDY